MRFMLADVAEMLHDYLTIEIIYYDTSVRGTRLTHACQFTPKRSEGAELTKFVSQDLFDSSKKFCRCGSEAHVKFFSLRVRQNRFKISGMVFHIFLQKMTNLYYKHLQILAVLYENIRKSTAEKADVVFHNISFKKMGILKNTYEQP